MKQLREMENKVKMTDLERDILIKHYSNVIAESTDLIDALQNKILEAESRIFDLTLVESLFTSSDIYKKDWPLFKRAEFVLASLRAIANTRKIAEGINRQEGGKLTEVEIKDLVSALGATLKQKVDKKVVFGRIEENGDILYGLIEWFNENGTVKSDLYRKGADPVTISPFDLE